MKRTILSLVTVSGLVLVAPLLAHADSDSQQTPAIVTKLKTISTESLLTQEQSETISDVQSELEELVDELEQVSNRINEKSSTLVDKLISKDQLKEELESLTNQIKEKKALLEQKKQEVAEAERQRQAAAAIQSQQTQVTSVSTASYGSGDAYAAFEQITAELGVTGIEKQIWADIISAESGWNTTVWNTSGSGAYGLGQALPASKMAPFGDDYMTNPYTQLKWMYSYVMNRYGSFQGVNWYSRGWY